MYRLEKKCVITCLLMQWLLLTANADDSSSLAFISPLLSVRPPDMVIKEAKRKAPDMFTTLEEDVRAKGYPVESHKVHTEDGYILTLHRIPRGREDTNVNGTKNPRPPVLLQHGMMSRSDCFVFLDPNLSPGLVLADRGYDVWLGNVRGSFYSSKHETLKRKDPRFWKFSWHEAGYYDIPAIIDHVLNTTSQDKLFYVGHSMGSTAFLVAMSLRPEYNVKIRLSIALGPAAYFDGTHVTLLRVLEEYADNIKAFADSRPTYELGMNADALSAYSYLVCGPQSYYNKMCAVFLSWIVGTIDYTDTSYISLVAAKIGSSTSLLTILHYLQVIKTGDFIMRDEGIEENTIKYGLAKPPKYPLGNVTTPMALFVSENDFITPVEGSRRLAEILPNVISLKIIKEKFFNHLDYIAHPRMQQILWKDILELMGRYV